MSTWLYGQSSEALIWFKISKSGQLSSQAPWLGEDPGAALVETDGGKLQLRGCSFGIGEPSIAPLPGLKHAIVIENNVRACGWRS